VLFMYENDYLMKQIEGLCRVLSMMFLKKDLPKEDIQEEKIKNTENNDTLLNQLKSMLENGKINEAEDLLFENVEKDESGYCLKAAIYFYSELNRLDDSTLKKYNFSRDEIFDGLNEINQKYNSNIFII